MDKTKYKLFQILKENTQTISFWDKLWIYFIDNIELRWLLLRVRVKNLIKRLRREL